jgi:AraC family transcriptional regulator
MRYAFDIPKFLEWVVQTWAPVSAAADRAAYSRSHFSRLFSKSVGESPRELRKRLQLEAGAHLLRKTEFKVGEVAVEVGYETPEAFTKAFRAMFGVGPREFRKGSDGTHTKSVRHGTHTKIVRHPYHLPTWLPSSNGIHFHPHGLIVRRQGDNDMKFSELLFRSYVDGVSTILDEMSKLTDDQLDAKTLFQGDEIPFDRHEKTLRATVKGVIFTHELWLAAFRGDGLPDLPKKPTVAELKEIHDKSGKALVEFVKEVEEKDLWASEFVDALCEEPVRFVFGAVLAHILLFGSHRRLMAIAALKSLGVKGLEYGDPINWLRKVSGEEMYVPECV